MGQKRNHPPGVRRHLLMPAALLAVMLLGLWVNQGALRELLLGDAPPLSPLPSASNRLALGEVTAVKGALTLPIAALAEFDGLSREQILALRREAVARQPKLLQGEYVPTPSVFGHIEGGRPWWGLAGRFYFGPGGESIAGLSTQSQHVLNPYLLVGADFWCDCELRWDLAKVTPKTALAPDFPYLPRIRSLTIQPGEARGEAVYEFSRFLKDQSALIDPKTSFNNPKVDLLAYNARDFGFDYVLVVLDESENISQKRRWARPAAIPHYLHAGGSCGYPGGCNNISPRFPPLEDIEIERLPATIVVKLWCDKPTSATNPPDFVFLLRVI